MMYQTRNRSIDHWPVL